MKDTKNKTGHSEEILNRIAVGIFRTDNQQNTLYANEALCQMCGLEMEQVLGGAWIKTIHPDDLDLVLTKWQEALEQGTSLYIQENRMVKPDGTLVWVSTFAR